MLRFIYRMSIIIFLSASVFSTGASGNDKAVDTSSVIEVKDNLLTVKARSISLKEVLVEITKQVPIKITFSASAEEQLVSNFVRLPMEKGLVKLLRNYSYAFTYGSAKSKGGEREIRKVIILSNGRKSRHRRM